MSNKLSSSFVAAVSIFLATLAEAQLMPWKLELPTGRRSFPMAFDSGRNVAVLFGGAGPDGWERNDTWEWDGTGWQEKALTGPRPSVRTASSMAFDSDRGVVVLFGGIQSTTFYGDTWEWDGGAWNLRSVNGPTPRYGHKMVYDSNRHVTVLFGGDGLSPGLLHDIWEWNGTAWTLINNAAPSTLARLYHGMAYDSVRSKLVVFGGYNPAYTPLDDLWEWNGTFWNRPLSSGPVARSSPAMTYDPDRRMTLMSGGFGFNGTSGALGDTWEWNGVRWLARADSPARGAHAMVFDPTNRKTLSFGGTESNSRVRGDLDQWDGIAWTTVSGRPKAGVSLAIAYDSFRDKTVSFGGMVSTYYPPHSGDTWEWSGRSWNKIPVTGPEPRANHLMAFDSVRRNIVLYGGSNWNTQFTDTWLFDGSTWTRSMAPGPSVRSRAEMAFDPIRAKLVLFGGMTGSPATYLNDTWEWDGSSWIQREVIGPSARISHKMYFDARRNVIVLLGGLSGTSESGEVWNWNGSTWTLDSVGAPVSLSWLAFDSDRQVALGRGIINGIGGDLIWNGATWSRLYLMDVGIYGGALAYESARHNMLFLSSSVVDYSYEAPTWSLSLECAAPSFDTHPVDQLICSDAVARFSIVAQCNENLSYRWHRMRTSGYQWEFLEDGPIPFGYGEVLGSSTPSLEVRRFRNGALGKYRCVVSSTCISVASESANTALCLGDFNCDTAVDFLDYLDFLNAFQSGAPQADFNHDDSVDVFDYLDFLTELRRGC